LKYRVAISIVALVSLAVGVYFLANYQTDAGTPAMSSPDSGPIVTSTTSSTGTTVSPTTTTEPDETTSTTAAPRLEGVGIRPGESIQAAVDAHPEGTTFILRTGTHSLDAPFEPKSRQKFIGESGAILSGNDRTEFAIWGQGAQGVEVRGLVVERFAGQRRGPAAIRAGREWTIVNNEVRHNSGQGIYHEEDALIEGNVVHHNRWTGIGGFKAHRSVIRNNEVYENGASLVPGEASGAKWVGAIDMKVQNNYFHHNHNNAIWFDSDSVNTVIEGNRAENNYGKGIHFENGCSGVIRNNISKNNEYGLFIVASSNTDVTGNTVSGNNEAIRVAHLDRPTGEKCKWILDNVKVRNNTVTGGMVRVLEHSPVPDPGAIFQPGNSRVVFDHNTYKGTTFTFDGNVSWSQWQAAGNDPNGNYSP